MTERKYTVDASQDYWYDQETMQKIEELRQSGKKITREEAEEILWNTKRSEYKTVVHSYKDSQDEAYLESDMVKNMAVEIEGVAMESKDFARLFNR